MSRSGGAPHEPNRTPAEVTADRLRTTASRYAEKLDADERAMVDLVADLFDAIATGRR